MKSSYKQIRPRRPSKNNQLGRILNNNIDDMSSVLDVLVSLCPYTRARETSQHKINMCVCEYKSIHFNRTTRTIGQPL